MYRAEKPGEEIGGYTLAQVYCRLAVGMPDPALRCRACDSTDLTRCWRSAGTENEKMGSPF